MSSTVRAHICNKLVALCWLFNDTQFRAELNLSRSVTPDDQELSVYLRFKIMYRHLYSVRDRIPVGTRFSARPDRPWGPPSLL